jgi:small subunit ribosomal protein S16
MGRRNLPVYKIVATDSRSPRDGRFLETVGVYNPRTEPAQIDLKEERVFYWLKRGAQPTDTVRSLLRHKGIMLKWHLVRKGTDEETIRAALEKWQMTQPEKAKREADRKARRAEIRRKKRKEAVEQPSGGEATPPAEGQQ